jgi:hypothetical protein
LKLWLKLLKKKVKCVNHNLVLVPYYAHHSGYPEEEIEKTTQEFSEFLSKIPIRNTTTIIGADINASIGIRTRNEYQNADVESNEYEFHEDSISDLIGPHGNPHKNENGE